MNAARSFLSRAIQRRGLILKRRPRGLVLHEETGLSRQRNSRSREPRYIVLAINLPILGEVCLHLDVRGSDRAGFQIACDDDVLLLRAEKEEPSAEDVPGKRLASLAIQSRCGGRECCQRFSPQKRSTFSIEVGTILAQ